MPTHIVLDSTPRLDEIAASLVLLGKRRVPVPEATTALFTHDLPRDECAEMIREIYTKVRTRKAEDPTNSNAWY